MKQLKRYVVTIDDRAWETNITVNATDAEVAKKDAFTQYVDRLWDFVRTSANCKYPHRSLFEADLLQVCILKAQEA
ncbi:hypothetical protein EOM81_01715 [bacterium]|nr:hypothetical protein [bacterium]